MGDLLVPEGGGEGEFRDRVAGIEIVFRATPGVTAEWFQRVVDCHLARNAVIGSDVASHEMNYCPLTLRGVTARVSSAGNGFAVAIQSEDQRVVEELRRRGGAIIGQDYATRP